MVKSNKTAVKAQKKKATAPRMVALNPKAKAWLDLLADPCSGNLTQPCYSGTDAGYLIRTVDPIAVTSTDSVGLTVGSTYSMFGTVAVTPSGYVNYGGVAGFTGSNAAATLVLSTLAQSGNFMNNASVRRFRPVAACLKWVPNGPINNRRGTIASGYCAGTPYNVTDSVTVGGVSLECTRVAPNGGEPHEVRWLPTALDENFTTATQASSGGGTMLMAFNGIDGTATSATNIVANGYLYVYIVWEWTPSGTNGITVAPKAPLPFTSQSVLATIGDMGAFLFKGLLSPGAGRIIAGVVSKAVEYNRGVQEVMTRAQNFITY